ncbi:AraC family transcriptional regulator [Polycyclovorans algicola]|uniref:AraC family transcriptional regulator n=1 Tax=Polycyclovorans algicola TaxID=616992 RepID=UPI0006948F5E|nr:AraC family transcriptional regulator [Polycyclovorans algicola]
MRQGVNVLSPVRSQQTASWGGMAVCEWKLPWVDGFELSENDDLVIALHSEGSRKVRAACNGPWSTALSMPGLLSVVPPGRHVRYRIDGEVSFATIHVPRQVVESLALASVSHGLDFRFAFDDAFAVQCMEILRAEARQADAGNFPYVHAVTRALLLHLMRGFRRAEAPVVTASDVAEHPHTFAKLDAMLDFIDAHLDEPLKLETLAAKAGVSRSHFVRRFRRLTGLTPHRYLTQRRIERARKLLRTTQQHLVDIALEVGFGNQSHFTQVFHSITGMTPSQFRRQAEIARGVSAKAEPGDTV